jgi:hypothetical protein
MKNKKLLYAGLILAALLSGLNIFALKFYLYWPKPGVFGFDTFMHFLGGLTLGMLAAWFFNIERRSLASFALVLVTVLVLGAVWEVFEYVFDITGTIAGSYWKDTIHDMVLDGIGGVVAYLVALSISKPTLPQE